MFFILILFTAILPLISAAQLNFQQNTDGFPVNSTVVFSSADDLTAITVQLNGEVSTMPFTNTPEQWWSVVPHPRDPDVFEFKQDVIPLNELSGFEDPPENPGMYPRPLGLVHKGIFGGKPVWNIRIRGRWCLQSNGLGFRMDYDDCEDFVAPYQLWYIQEITAYSSNAEKHRFHRH